MALNEAFFRIKSNTLSIWSWSSDARVFNKESSRSLWFLSSWITRLTATFRLRSRVGSKKHSVPADRQALHGDSGPEHYIEQITTISHFVPNFRTRRRGRNGKENRDQLMHRLTFLFACLHARQAVEFFFGLLTAVDICGANMRGGPGASAGNCFVFSWGLIFIFKRSASRSMISQRNASGFLTEIYRDWSFRGNGNLKQRFVGTDFWDSAGKTVLYTRLKHGPNASSYGPSKSTSPTSHQHDVRKGVSVMSQWYGRHGAVRYLRMKVGHN